MELSLNFCQQKSTTKIPYDFLLDKQQCSRKEKYECSSYCRSLQFFSKIPGEPRLKKGVDLQDAIAEHCVYNRKLIVEFSTPLLTDAAEKIAVRLAGELGFKHVTKLAGLHQLYCQRPYCVKVRYIVWNVLELTWTRPLMDSTESQMMSFLCLEHSNDLVKTDGNRNCIDLSGS